MGLLDKLTGSRPAVPPEPPVEAPPSPSERTLLPSHRLASAMQRTALAASVCPHCGGAIAALPVPVSDPRIQLARDPELAAKGWTRQDEIDAEDGATC